jgi:hypothetical protein
MTSTTTLIMITIVGVEAKDKSEAEVRAEDGGARTRGAIH